MAVRINLSQSRLSKLEQNPGAMTVEQLLALCGSLGLDLTLQVRGTDEPATPAEW
ncbi:helix-turn-helix transcriptional regulator [Sphaerotilus montanus]|nr:helix-turn-helix transcriptional regulator [Sphaerotilus montanus]